MPFLPATPIPVFHDWLVSERTANGRYAHHLLREVTALRPAAIAALHAAIERINEDVRARLRLAHIISLDPFAEEPVVDPARGYPDFLDFNTLKGYFGEVLSGLLAVTYGAHGIDIWEIPGFLIRFHEAALQYLERQQQAHPDGDPNLAEIDQEPRIPGRTGDDCLAFQRDANGQIIRVLCCEAKCTINHAVKHIHDAHEKASEAALKPIDLRLLVELLENCDEPAAVAWRDALLRLRFAHALPAGYERCDLVCYIYGRAPIREPAWLPVGAPHPRYTARRRLEAVEVCLPSIRDLVLAVYRAAAPEHHEAASC
jgi:hypothetical protein